MIKLRDYQQNLVTLIYAAWLRVRALLVVLATGGGKTIIFSSIMHDHVGASAAVVHRKEIVSQIALSLAALEVKHRVIAPPNVVAMIRRKQLKRFGKSYVDPHAQAGVVSVQTMTSRGAEKNKELQRWLAQVTLSVFDEGHHYVSSGLWAKAVKAVSHAKTLFVTATPERADGKGLGAHADGFAEEMIEGPSTKELIENGYLSSFKYVAPDSDLDVSGIPITATGDLNTKELRKRVVDSSLVGDVVQHYLARAKGKKCIVFATDVQTAEEIADAFKAAGVKATALSGDTDAGVRDHALDEFEFSDLDVLVNVNLFDEGFDVPAAEVCILARPTESLAKFLQMIGRILRVVYAKGYDLTTVQGRLDAIANGPKPFGLVIDPVRNWERHGMPNWPRVWTLDSKSKRGGGGASDTIPMKICVGTKVRPGCTQPYEAFYPACPYCGAINEPAGRAVPEQVEGDLMELDVEAMAALFERMNHADMSDEDYAVDQIGRHIPRVGRGADMKRHQASKYRRKVLRELVAWQIGMQPHDRTMSEKHRRFFHFFGIDIGTAFTLNAKDTDLLIEKIQKRFTESICK